MSKNKNKNTMSPLTKHLLPSRLEFDTNKIYQPNFIRKEFIVRNLPQTIKDDNRQLFMSIVQMPNTTISIRVSDMNYYEVKRLVDKQLNDTYSGRHKRKITDRLEAEGDATRLTEFYRERQRESSNGSTMKYVNIFIEVYGTDEKNLEDNINKVKALCDSLQVSIEECLLSQKEGFVGVSPIGNDTRGKHMANNIPSNTFGQLYPFSQSSLNDDTGMLIGRTIDNGMVNVDIWRRNISRTNSNIAVVGDSGQGKSYLIKKIILQQYIRGSTIFNFDSDNEYGTLCKKLGGTNINCSRGNFTINPFEVRYFINHNDDDDDVDQTVEAFNKDNTPFFQHLSWLSDFFKVLIPSLANNKNTDAVMQLNALKMFVQDLYKKFCIDENTDFSKLSAKDYPIMSDLYNYIYDAMEHREKYNFYKMIDEKIVDSLLLLLYDVHKGSLSPMFNKHTNIINSNFINFNIQELLMGSEDNMQAILFNYLTYIWSRVISRQENIVLCLDELYLLVNKNNLTIAKYFNTFVRRARKYEALLITGTQRTTDCLSSDISYLTSAILETPTYKFFFYPGKLDLNLMKDKLGLSDGEVKIISTSAKRNCLFKCGNDKYHIVIGTLPFEQKLFGKGGGR